MEKGNKMVRFTDPDKQVCNKTGQGLTFVWRLVETFFLLLAHLKFPPLYLWFKHFGHSSQMTTECVSQHEEVLETWERRLAKCFIVQDINRTVENSENVCVCGGGWVELFIIFAAYKHMQIHSACHAAGMRYPIFAFHLFPQDLSYQLALLQI